MIPNVLLEVEMFSNNQTSIENGKVFVLHFREDKYLPVQVPHFAPWEFYNSPQYGPSFPLGWEKELSILSLAVSKVDISRYPKFVRRLVIAKRASLAMK